MKCVLWISRLKTDKGKLSERVGHKVMGLKYCYLKQYHDCQAASFFVFTIAIPKVLTFVFLSVFYFIRFNYFSRNYKNTAKINRSCSV